MSRPRLLPAAEYAAEFHVEVLRWARENGAPWTAYFRDLAAAELGYTKFGFQ